MYHSLAPLYEKFVAVRQLEVLHDPPMFLLDIFAKI
jgi:hypothetical protein